ncbi:hypothetical protein ULG90_09035 [Halopseudomonas pachastrellae]|nr:hypothetical protein ULG90_09035 [Halopseudomonas pachastrellae]
MKVLRERSGQRRLLLLLVVALLVLLSWLGQGDRSSAAHLDASLLQASVAFASARALNALISVLHPPPSASACWRVAVTLGEMLDPFNDLIEQYAYLMQWAIGSLLAQKILLGLVGQTFFQVLLTFSAVLLGAALWARGGRHAGLFLRLFLAIAFLRFVLVAVVLVNGEVDRWYLTQQSREQIALLDRLPGEVEVLGADANADAALLGGSAAGQALDSQLAMLDEQRSRLITAQRDAGRAISEQRQALTALEQQLDWSERLNPFADVPAREDAANKLALLRGSYQRISQELSEVEQQREQVLRSVQHCWLTVTPAGVALASSWPRWAIRKRTWPSSRRWMMPSTACCR